MKHHSIHCSQLGEILDCPRRAMWKHANPTGGKEAIGVAAMVGTLAHDHLENLSKGKTDATWMAAEMRARLVTYDGTTPTATEAMFQAERIAEIAFESFDSPEMKVAHELPVEAALNGVNVVGRVDCLLNPDDNPQVKDLKTGRVGLEHAAALGAYSILTDATLNPVIIPIERKRSIDEIAADDEIEFDLRECRAMAFEAAILWRKWFDVVADAERSNRVQANPYSRMCTASTCPIFGAEACPIHQT